MNIQLYNRDCMEVINRMEDDSIGITITSPPYNMNLRLKNGKYCSRQIVKEISNKYKNFSDNLSIDDFYSFHTEILSNLIRVSRLVFYNIGIVTGSKRAFFKMIGHFNEDLKDIVVWDKVRSAPAINPGVLTRRTELILVFSKDAIARTFSPCNFDRGTETDLWKIEPDRRDLEINQARFPLGLPLKIISLFGQKNDVIFDPFLGTGTTGIAAVKMGYDFIGSELDKETFDYAKKSIQEERNQLKLW